MARLVRCLSLAEAATALGLTHESVLDEVAQGHLRVGLVGSTFVVSPREIKRYRQSTRGQTSDSVLTRSG